MHARFVDLIQTTCDLALAYEYWCPAARPGTPAAGAQVRLEDRLDYGVRVPVPPLPIDRSREQAETTASRLPGGLVNTPYTHDGNKMCEHPWCIVHSCHSSTFVLRSFRGWRMEAKDHPPPTPRTRSTHDNIVLVHFVRPLSSVTAGRVEEHLRRSPFADIRHPSPAAHCSLEAIRNRPGLITSRDCSRHTPPPAK